MMFTNDLDLSRSQNFKATTQSYTSNLSQADSSGLIPLGFLGGHKSAKEKITGDVSCRNLRPGRVKSRGAPLTDGFVLSVGVPPDNGLKTCHIGPSRGHRLSASEAQQNDAHYMAVLRSGSSYKRN
jgi:hypothetical protein